jgi:predicted transcriptional regulator
MKTKLKYIFSRVNSYLSLFVRYHYEVLLDKMLEIVESNDRKTQEKVTKNGKKVIKNCLKVKKSGSKCGKCSCSTQKNKKKS